MCCEREDVRAGRLENGGRLVKAFQQQVVPSRSKNEADDYSGDRKVMKSMSLPAGKRLPAKVLGNNYMYLYLSFKLDPTDADSRRDFLAAKLEATRFHQWAAPNYCTVTQVTPVTNMYHSREGAIETALCNIFSVTLKPVNTRAFVRAVRQRFELCIHEAFSWGPAGMFRPDIQESMRISRIPINEKKGQAGQCVFGRIVIILVHHRLTDTNHVAFTVSRGQYKQCPDGGCKAPTFLPGRTCVTWAPGVSFKDVEAWLLDIMCRPCMQLAVEDSPDTDDIQFAEEHFIPQNPFTAGARMVKAALTPEYSDLRDDMKPFIAVTDVPPISDQSLLATPVPSASSSEDVDYFDD